jgi:hypothetical protein
VRGPVAGRGREKGGSRPHRGSPWPSRRHRVETEESCPRPASADGAGKENVGWEIRRYPSCAAALSFADAVSAAASTEGASAPASEVSAAAPAVLCLAGTAALPTMGSRVACW